MHKKCCLPKDIPIQPYKVYKNNGWNGLGDWLGTGIIATNLRKYRTFKQARDFVHSLNLNSQKEWKIFCKGQLLKKGVLPSDIPAAAHRIYKNKGWKGYRDWLKNS